MRYLSLVILVVLALSSYAMFFTKEDRIIRAVKGGNLDKVRDLLQNGANPNTMYKPFMGGILKYQYIDQDSSLLILAQQNKDKSFEMSKLLLEQGASLENTKFPDSSILYFAFFNIDVVRLMVEYGADLHKTDRNGNNLLHKMPWNDSQIDDQMKVAAYYIASGLNPYDKNKNGDNAFDLAKKKNEKAYKLLTERFSVKPPSPPANP